MKFFNELFQSLSEKKDSPAPVSPQEQSTTLTPEQSKAILAELHRITAAPAFSLKIQPESKPGLFDSKFGGLPYWDLSRPYPTAGNDAKLMLLAQLNLEELPPESPLPSSGMLQFFIASDDDCFGMDFDQQDSQDGFRVIWHEELDHSITEEQIRELEPPIATDPAYEEYSPVVRECAVKIIPARTEMGVCDYRFDELFRHLAQEWYNVDLSHSSLLDVMEKDEFNRLADANTGHWLLGYPYFTQSDPREYTEANQRYDMLLFQMDSEFIDKKDYVLWGDVGVCGFFINHEDLERQDFSRVLYNWDCC